MLVLQPFLDRHPPSTTRKADPALVERYRGLLPDSLLALWAEVGFGTYSEGQIQLINPERYQACLWGWLMLDEDDDSRLPLAISAFGHIFYYRRLSDEGDEDVALIDPHRSESEVLAWSLEAFFNEVLCDEESIDSLLDRALFKAIPAAKGALQPDEIYYFVPALRLGGTASADHVDRGDALVHLEFLLQLALG